MIETQLMGESESVSIVLCEQHFDNPELNPFKIKNGSNLRLAKPITISLIFTSQFKVNSESSLDREAHFHISMFYFIFVILLIEKLILTQNFMCFQKYK